MPLKGLFKGDGGGGGGRDGSTGGGSSSRDSSTHGGRDSKLMSKAKALLATAAAPLSARGRERASDRPYFNPEEHISEKREWSRRYTQSQGGAAGMGLAAPKPPDRLYEHFAVVGLPPTMNIKAVAADIKTFQRLSREGGGLGGGGAAAAAGMEVTADTPREEKQRQYGLKGPAHPAEVLYSFPAAMPADLEQGLAAFCFPHGVRPELLERTPSMSALNEVIYSQPYQTHDDHSFVFTMKVVDPGSIAPRTLYGVCCYVRELVHRPPSMAREAYPGCNAPLSRYLVVAPRCYCLLTHHPFFALHFRVLQTILGLERLERMTNFAAELAGLQEGGGQPGASWASSSLASSSAGAGSTASLGQGPGHSGGAGQAAMSGAAGGAGRAAGALAALPASTTAGPAQRAEDAGDEDESEAGSSRRWTEGSSVVADGQQQGADLAAALLELSLSEQRQLQAAQAADQPRPTRLAQVSPHCPEAPPAATPPSNRQGAAQAGAADMEEEQATTPPDQVQPVRLAAAVGPTPFFTPAGLSSALGTPAGHSRTAAWGQAAAAAGQPDASGGTRRALEDVLAEAGGSSTGSPEAPGPAAAASPAADGAAVDGSEAEAAAAAATEAASASRPGSGREHQQQQQQQQRPESDDGSSDAESYLTASSSTALLAQQAAGLDASPATAAFLASSRKAQHARSVSGTSLASVGAAAASPAPLLDVSDAQRQLGQPPAQQQEQEQQGEEEAPPLLQLLLDQGSQQTSGQNSTAQPPLLDLGSERDQQQAADRASPDQQQGPLVDLEEPSQGTPSKAAQQAAGPPAVQEQLAQLDGQAGGLLLEETPVKEQQLGSGVAVRIVRRSYSSPAQGHGVADTPPRADLLTGSAVSRSARHPLNLPPTLMEGDREGSAAMSTGSPASSLLPPAEAQPGVDQGAAQQAGDQQPPAAQHAAQQQWGAEGALVRHEVVRVTASNLDMSRPLRSADLLAVYHASVVPRPGQVFEFQPDPGLQTIQFERPDLVEAVRELGLRPDATSLPDIDAAQNLGGWAVAALCRAMSLDNIITFLTAALLERQIVVFCPNAGLLSGVVLSLIPLLLPFHWQCLLLPVLPAAEGRLELMEAPVPFVLGVLYKTPEVRAKCSSLVRVNVYKDKVKNVGGLPPLPQQAALHDALLGTYAELRKIGMTRAAMTRPIHMISDAQQVLAECFLSTLQKYLKGLMADLRAYCITDVSASMERTSVLLKESFVDSFPPRDRPFMRQFAETQMFAVYTDAVLG